MKKTFSWLLAIALLICALPVGMAETEQITLTFQRIGNDEPEKNYWLSIIEAFEAENPDIKIEYDDAAIGSDMDTKLNSLFDAGIGPDIIGHGILSVASRVEQGQYMAIDEYFETWEGKDDILEAVLANGTYNGSIYGLGYSVTPYVFAYRKDLFEQAGLDPAVPPKTWEELADFARKLTIKDDSGEITQAGFAFPSSGGNMVEYDVFVYGNGGTFMDENGEPVMNSEEQVEAFEFLQSFLSEVNIPYDNNQNNPFLRGKAAMCLINNAELSAMLKDPAYEGKIGVALPPNNGVEGTFCGCNMLFISTDCEQPEAAFRFIAFCLSQESILKRAQDLNVPVVLKSLEDEFVALDPDNAARNACVACGTGMPRAVWSSTFQRLRNEAIQNVLFADADPATILDAAYWELMDEISR